MNDIRYNKIVIWAIPISRTAYCEFKQFMINEQQISVRLFKFINLLIFNFLSKICMNMLCLVRGFILIYRLDVICVRVSSSNKNNK